MSDVDPITRLFSQDSTLNVHDCYTSDINLNCTPATLQAMMCARTHNRLQTSMSTSSLNSIVIKIPASILWGPALSSIAIVPVARWALLHIKEI